MTIVDSENWLVESHEILGQYDLVAELRCPKLKSSHSNDLIAKIGHIDGQGYFLIEQPGYDLNQYNPLGSISGKPYHKPLDIHRPGIEYDYISLIDFSIEQLNNGSILSDAFMNTDGTQVRHSFNIAPDSIQHFANRTEYSTKYIGEVITMQGLGGDVSFQIISRI
jgi:hypothetical protein